MNLSLPFRDSGLRLVSLFLVAALPGLGAEPLTSVDLGAPAPLAGTTTFTADSKGVTLQGYGTLFGLHTGSDQGRFAYTRVKGDFDVIVQVAGVSSSTKALAEGGLMVRQDLNPRGLMLANFVTGNDYAGGACDKYTFMFRLQEGGSIEPIWDMAIEGFYGDHTFGNPGFGYTARGYADRNEPARNFPYVWVRIIRQGNTYKAYRREGVKSDWGKWEKMSEITVDLGDEPYVGIALSANHHHPTIPGGRLGEPDSRSEIAIASITGLPGFPQNK